MSKQPVVIDGWTVLTPKHISRRFEAMTEALLEAMRLREKTALLGEVTGRDDYSITLRQTTVHVRVK